MKCIIEKCKRDSSLRGLCKSCYQQASHLVRTKRTSWAELVKRKLVLPRTLRTAPFMAAFKRSKEK